MSRIIPLIGGSQHGRTIQLPDVINFHALDMGTIGGEEIYTICKSEDGYFYAVFNPSSNDPSVARIEAIRNSILGAM